MSSHYRAHFGTSSLRKLHACVIGKRGRPLPTGKGQGDVGCGRGGVGWGWWGGVGWEGGSNITQRCGRRLKHSSARRERKERLMDLL